MRAYAHFVRWKHRDVEAPTKKTLFEFTRLAIVGRFLYLYLPEYCLFKQVLQALPLDSLHNVLVFLSMPVVAFSVINIVLTLSSFLWLNRPLACLFILVGAAAQYFIMTYGIVIDRSMIANIIDTTPAESYALMTPQMLLTLGFSGVLAALIACWIKIKPATSRLRSVLFRGANILVSVLLILLVAALFYKDYASLFRNNKELVKSLSPSNSIVASWSWYSHQRLANLPLVRIGEDAHRNPLMQNEKRKNLTILIVGETSRAENFSLNGYPRETNPRLAKDNVVYFPNTASCGTATAVSVPCMFSDMPREHYKEELAQHQKACWISFSERASTCCGMTTMAAVKVPATACLTRTSPR